MATGPLPALQTIALSQSVLDRVSQEAQDAIIPLMWFQPTAVSPSLSRDDWDSYFKYYSSECYSAITMENGRYFAARTHFDIMTLNRILVFGAKGNIRQGLKPLVFSPTPQGIEDATEGSIILIARLLSMVDIGPQPYRPRDVNSVQWKDDTIDLRQLLVNHFVPQVPGNQSDAGYDQDLTAHNLHRYAELEFEWTDNLADHLRISNNGAKVAIFSHATFLRYTGKYVYNAHES